MPAIILSLLGGGWNILKLAGSWLSHRSLAEIGCLVLALVCVVQTVRIEGVGIWPLSIAGFKAELSQAKTDLNAARDQLKAISTARDNQKVVTAKTVEHVKERVKQADYRAKVVEQAPLNGKCETPKEILQADL